MNADRLIRVGDLVGAKAIAERLGLAYPQGVSLWARRHTDFPEAVYQLGKGKVWAWPDVEAWAKATGRQRRLALRSGNEHAHDSQDTA